MPLSHDFHHQVCELTYMLPPSHCCHQLCHCKILQDSDECDEELKPGALYTTTVTSPSNWCFYPIAATKCVVVVLKKPGISKTLSHIPTTATNLPSV